MITILTGENSFEIQQAIKQITDDFDGVVEKIDGSDLQLSQLPDILMGASLFSTARTVIIRGLSQNKAIWAVFGDWVNKVSDDIHLVLIDPKIDKRTAAYKALKPVAALKDYPVWTDRDSYQAEKWAIEEAKIQGIDLNKKCVQALVQRVGVDQWQLYYAIQKLSLAPGVTLEIIINLIEVSPVENVFTLLETSIDGDIVRLKSVLSTLEKTEDIFRLSALLFSQVFQLAAVSAAESGDNPVKDFTIHPFVHQKMTSLGKKLGKAKIAKIINIFAECDDDMKISRAEPWLLLERALIKVATLAS